MTLKLSCISDSHQTGCCACAQAAVSAAKKAVVFSAPHSCHASQPDKMPAFRGCSECVDITGWLFAILASWLRSDQATQSSLSQLEKNSKDKTLRHELPRFEHVKITCLTHTEDSCRDFTAEEQLGFCPSLHSQN